MGRMPPIPKGFTAVLAERELVLRGGGKDRKICLQIGTPIQDVLTVSGRDWRCPFRITDLAGNKRTLQAYGIDSLQSLFHALSLVERELARIERDYGEQLRWLGDLPHGCPKIDLASLTQ